MEVQEDTMEVHEEAIEVRLGQTQVKYVGSN